MRQSATYQDIKQASTIAAAQAYLRANAIETKVCNGVLMAREVVTFKWVVVPDMSVAGLVAFLGY